LVIPYIFLKKTQVDESIFVFGNLKHIKRIPNLKFNIIIFSHIYIINIFLTNIKKEIFQVKRFVETTTVII
jgi:hypothetical protein